MSITFYPNKEWKMVENPCDICGDNCDAGSDGNPYCTGTRPEPDCPTINMANGNAYAMLALLGLPTDECCGEVSANDLPRVMRAIIRARNVSARRTKRRLPVSVPPNRSHSGTRQAKSQRPFALPHTRRS